MTNVGYQGAESRLAAINAMHSDTALRLINVRDHIEGKSARAAFLHPAARAKLSILDNILGEMPMRNPSETAGLSEAEEAALRGQLDAHVQKVLGIIAVLINETGADIADMEGMIDLIQAMDREFFDFADDPEAAAEKCPIKREARIVQHLFYRRAYYVSWLVGVSTVTEE